MTTAQGYGIDVTLDGQALRVHPRSKIAATALFGGQRAQDRQRNYETAGTVAKVDLESDLVIPLGSLRLVQAKAPGRVVNGEIRVSDARDEWRVYRLHFRWGQREAYAALVGQMQAVNS